MVKGREQEERGVLRRRGSGRKSQLEGVPREGEEMGQRGQRMNGPFSVIPADICMGLDSF